MRLNSGFPAHVQRVTGTDLVLALENQHEPKEALAHARKARDLVRAAGQEEIATKAESLNQTL